MVLDVAVVVGLRPASTLIGVSLQMELAGQFPTDNLSLSRSTARRVGQVIVLEEYAQPAQCTFTGFNLTYE